MTSAVVFQQPAKDTEARGRFVRVPRALRYAEESAVQVLSFAVLRKRTTSVARENWVVTGGSFFDSLDIGRRGLVPRARTAARCRGMPC